ncbi:hypothetical protein J3E64_001002 [Sphingobium sp. OAS761]|uniref:hypothetical protein n=1 Tax=Sphingobium sp. OAS761 TaxID=2817901 RepID=UPI00209DE9DD|nr:hypothetical protein [Sphingobium sp. OAS761]MCP1469327.1 hypothetical protein [Sphingobium sp. OAS761]
MVATDDPEELLNEIGRLLAEDREYPSEPTLLYAQLDHNMIGESIFKELGNQVLYRWPVNERLPYALLDLWELQEGKNRWMELEYLVRDGRFEVAYIYPDAIDPNEDVVERRARSVRQHFGEKPIIYPPWPSEDDVAEYGV